MLNSFVEVQKLGTENLEESAKQFGALAKSAQLIASEMAEYSKKSIEDGSKVLGMLLEAKTPERALKIQADFTKAALDNYIAELTKVSALYADLAKETFKSFKPSDAKAASKK